MSESKSLQYMPFFVGDYLRDTMHLSTEEHGAYILLIMACWNGNGKVKASDKHCSSIARVSLEQWHSIKENILPFFEIAQDYLVHRKVEKIRQESMQKYENRRLAGSKGGIAKAKAQQSSSNATSNALAKGVANGKQKPSNQNHNHISSKEDKKCEKFAQWYDLYDKKRNPKKALEIWDKLKDSEKDECLKVVVAYVKSTPEKSYRKDPERYLKNRGWEDEIISSLPQTKTTTITNGQKKETIDGWLTSI